MAGIQLELSCGQLFCHRFGEGQELLIALHGFGHSGAVFKAMAHSRFTTYAVDLPFHGRSSWRGDLFRADDLLELYDLICNMAGKRRFHLLGHSLGGRLAWKTAPLAGARLQGLYLLAPDGLQTRWMGLPELIPVKVRRWMQPLFLRPAPLLWIVTQLHRAGLVDPFVPTYLQDHLRTPRRQLRLFHTWMSTAGFRLSTPQLVGRLQGLSAPVKIVAGRKDALVAEDKLREVARQVRQAELIVLDKGHMVLDRETAGILFDR